MNKFKKLTLIVLLIFTLIGCSNIENIKNKFSKECAHEYILEPIQISSTQKFGLTEVIYYREKDTSNEFDKDASIIFTGVIENIESEKSKSSLDTITSINIKPKSNSYLSYDEQNGEYADFQSAAGTKEGFLRVHKDDKKHREVNMIIGLEKDLEEYTSFEITFNKYDSEYDIVIDVPIELVKEELNYQKLKKDLFNKYYEVIDNTYSSNEIFEMKLKEIYLDDRDFFGQIEVENVSEYDFENLSMFVNPIMSDGFGYMGKTNPSFDRINGYLSLKSGESRTIDFRVNIDEAMDNLYFGDDELYPEREIVNEEKFIFAVGISKMGNDENMIFPDSNLGTVMHYFKGNLKVGAKEYSEKEREELKKKLIIQDTESIYDFDIKVEDIYKVNLEEQEEDVLVAELDITNGEFNKKEDILTVYGLYNGREEEIYSNEIGMNLYQAFGSEDSLNNDCIIPVLGWTTGDTTLKTYISIELEKYDDHEKFDGYKFEIAKEDNLEEAFTFTVDKKIIQNVTQDEFAKSKYNEIKEKVSKAKCETKYGKFEVKNVSIEDDHIKVTTKFKNTTSKELENIYFDIRAIGNTFGEYIFDEENDLQRIEKILPGEEVSMEWESHYSDDIEGIENLIIRLQFDNFKVGETMENQILDISAAYWQIK